MKRLVLALVAVSAVACAPLSAQKPAPTRPACADKVAAAFTSSTPIKGAFACMVGHYGDNLSGAGITSDDSWAAHNKTAGISGPFVFETRLHDGAYLYHNDVRTTSGGVVTLNLILYVARDGEIYTFVIVSVLS